VAWGADCLSCWGDKTWTWIWIQWAIR